MAIFNFPKEHSEYRTTVTLVMGVLFLLAAAILLGNLGYRSVLVIRFRDAIEVPAIVREVRLSSSGKSQRVVAKYEYQCNGQRYEADRVALFSESAGTYHRLLNAKEANRPVACFVDRRNPGLSTLDRGWRVLDMLAFAGFGGVFGYVGALYVVRHIQATARVPRRR